MSTQQTPATIYAEALAAAERAIAALGPEDIAALDCGYAWVTVRPARGAFVTWCRANKYGASGYPTGWEFWCPGRFRGQAIGHHRAGAEAFADVLAKHGISATTGSRLD